MATFFFKGGGRGRQALAAAGSRADNPHREPGRRQRRSVVARELRKQGLTPVYVGWRPRERPSRSSCPPSAQAGGATCCSSPRNFPRCSTPGCRSTARFHHRRADRAAAFRFIVLDVLRVLKGGKSLADSLGTHPRILLRPVHQHGARRRSLRRAGPIFERLAEFERSRDDLRNYIVSSMIYPALLAAVGLGSILILLTSWCRASPSSFRFPHEDPRAHQIMLEAATFVKTYWWIGAAALVAASHFWRVYTRTVAGRLWWDGRGSRFRCSATRCSRPRRRGSRAPWRRWWPTPCRWCNPSPSPRPP
jgi:hypothetical protein